MLYDIYMDAIKNRQSMLTRLREHNVEKIYTKARSQWTEYLPRQLQCSQAGIDSSWNKKSFQGFDVYAVSGLSVSNDNVILDKQWDIDIGLAKEKSLESSSLLMESKSVNISNNLVDLVLVDGSLSSKFVNQTKSIIDQIAHNIRNIDNLIFVSKTSESTRQFGSFGTVAGDIYYYNQVAKSAGYSNPVANFDIKSMPVYELYARLKPSTPALKIEIPLLTHKKYSEDYFKYMLDLISYQCVSGYPYCLKLAHQNCKITNEDMRRLVNMFGFSNEIGARDALLE